MQSLQGNFSNSLGARKGSIGMLLLPWCKWVCLLLQNNVVPLQLWEFCTSLSLPTRFDRFNSFVEKSGFLMSILCSVDRF